MRVILVEDNLSLAKGIENALKDQGHAVDHLEDGLDADAFLSRQTADVAIIDINLPRLCGLEIIRRMRARRDTMPILVLTAQGKTSDRVEGLDAGADDYLVKPFDMEELVARLRALSRRRPQVAPTREPVGQLLYDREQRIVLHADRNLDLPRRELALFELLLENRGRLIEKDRIADSLYGTGTPVEPNAVELLVSRLRRKIDGSGVTIRTARGLGYMLDEI
ncbi:response regulator transcription factor (plasmid) [Gemmobacter fulvus]|uniref:Response regulator transcription factor n=1 Tax=Gemmobacter fulvus TaxID=2840474 RepID=A0A975PA94_9RHOB|nr:response regulator transcription factor [Gemmobacter fulvus]MBT9246430.1 response regulator transcription factor [Gemmobacter fulvus]MDQ1849761.1 response regulator transcription factor [Gemmobacter fulvus]QWK92534.1 response regulator transcription factor [Gemmobacter fulvus]